MPAQNEVRATYLRDQESFMYDREPRFPMVDTRNSARIEYTENGITNLAGRHCDIIRISMTQAVLALLTQYKLPTDCYLDLPDARIAKIGCKVMRVNPNNTIEVRFLRMLTDKEMNRIFVYSTHPSHRDAKLDIRG